MTIRSKDPMQQAQQFYEAMIRDLIVDVPLDDGRYRPQLNFTELVKRVTEDPKPAQIAAQFLRQADIDSDVERQQADLHGTWIMAALISAFGVEDDTVRWMRKAVPDYYEAAVLMLKKDE